MHRDLTQKKVESIIDDYIDLVIKSLVKNKIVKIRDFGTLKVCKSCKVARTDISGKFGKPKKDAKLEKISFNSIRFVISQKIKKIVNEKEAP